MTPMTLMTMNCRGSLKAVRHLSRDEPGGLGERPGRDAAVVGAGSAELVALDQDDLRPQLPGSQGRGYPRRPSTYYH